MVEDVKRYAYFVYCPYTSLVKIGRSKDPRRRMFYLKLKYHRELVLLGSIEYSPGFMLETELHILLKRYRFHYPPRRKSPNSVYGNGYKDFRGGSEWFLAEPALYVFEELTEGSIPAGLKSELGYMSNTEFRLIAEYRALAFQVERFGRYAHLSKWDNLWMEYWRDELPDFWDIRFVEKQLGKPTYSRLSTYQIHIVGDWKSFLRAKGFKAYFHENGRDPNGGIGWKSKTGMYVPMTSVYLSATDEGHARAKFRRLLNKAGVPDKDIAVENADGWDDPITNPWRRARIPPFDSEET